ncbi:BAF_collapsed_G0013890.mRNA.1.CDS.1 [Saccharomyces cerevisiae]|nr:BAF_HP2_G0013430.mRNA.1.CDS.1 [Saccharomyces cerevisiae]CAI6450978.1 BAF_HP1_G0013860.mRNA.1.CDS.1 [Saccharomyces cerevisiae]CAI6454108.1 BAF_HP2_G0013430.mRNA.1.CDS.1 [Saccharomyces cerevisiae]CAI7088338.1 BAF_collapsed_G0013890.mRNA.1.CDS.1 [Saccharomyces cerevisiae]
MLNLIGNILLSVWNIKEGAKWFAFILQYTAFATLPLVYSLQSEICSDNQWERSIILVSMNMAAQSSIAWISVIVWKTADAPQFFKGYIWAAISSFTMMGFTIIVLIFFKRERKQEQYNASGDDESSR